jgi:hypothetical protein
MSFVTEAFDGTFAGRKLNTLNVSVPRVGQS